MSTCGTEWSTHRTNRKRDAETETLLRGSTRQTKRDAASETERNRDRQTNRDRQRRRETDRDRDCK